MYKCDECDHLATRQFNLKAHKRNKHSKENAGNVNNIQDTEIAGKGKNGRGKGKAGKGKGIGKENAAAKKKGQRKRAVKSGETRE